MMTGKHHASAYYRLRRVKNNIHTICRAHNMAILKDTQEYCTDLMSLYLLATLNISRCILLTGCPLSPERPIIPGSPFIPRSPL